MSFFRLATPTTAVASEDAATSDATPNPVESTFSRMIRLWLEYNLRVAQLRMLDR